MRKWQEDYLNEIKNKSNEECLDEYSYLCGGDDYDGCHTTQGEWKYEQITKELTKRLQEIGFLIKQNQQ